MPEKPTRLPLRRITTALDWQDRTLPSQIRRPVEEILSRLRPEPAIEDRRPSRSGVAALFSGPSGTGKTLTAALLGRASGRSVYRVDLSQVISKYIGETEKNLARILEGAQRHDWILFFDEADALFGRRTEVEDAHDRYANQETSYLLQRIEEFHGVVILATNSSSSLDDVLTRRFQVVAAFPVLDPPERTAAWRDLVEIHDDVLEDGSAMTSSGRRDTVRTSVKTLLEGSPAFRDLPESRRRSVAEATVVVAEALAGDPLVREVDFPGFVGGLIDGVFAAIVDASIRQMEAYADLIEDVASDVDEFTAGIDDNKALEYLEERGVDSDSDRWSRSLASLLLPAARAEAARSRQRLLATVILVGIHRILEPDCDPDD